MSSNAITEWIASLSDNQRKLLTTPEGRRAVTKYDFESFCMVYFRHLLKGDETGGQVSWSEFHRDFIDNANKYTVGNPGIAKSRTAWVCPRGAGKSTILRMLLIWLGAHGHQKLVVMLSATATQAELHLSNMRQEFDSNELLGSDYPDLVKAATRKMAAVKMADNRQLIMQQNGFIVTARGVETKLEGLNINGRPNMIILDDIEASEADTTKNDVETLLDRIKSNIFPLNINAHVCWIGTTTRPGGLVEGLVHKALDMSYPQWVDEDNWKVHYHPALRTLNDGTQVSMWPERWNIEWLLSQQHYRDFAKSFLCLPIAEDSPYWSSADITIEQPEELTHVLLSIDPAVTSNKRSDETGLAVIGWSQTKKRIYVLHVEGVRLGPEDLRLKVLSLLATYPQIGLIYIEVNQGGEYIQNALHNLPVKIKTMRQTVKKELRAANTLVHYQRGRVFHAKHMPLLETQMFQFPGGAHDDMVDAVTTGVLYFAEPKTTVGSTPAVRTVTYT